MAVKGVQYLKDNYNVEVNEIINDGDSRAYNALLEAFDWFIKKYYCINHLLKNLKGHLIELRENE